MELVGNWWAGVGAGGQLVGRCWCWWATGRQVLELLDRFWSWWAGIGAGGKVFFGAGGQWKAGVGAGGQIVGRYWSWWATGVRVLELVGNWWSGIGAGGHCWALLGRY